MQVHGKFVRLQSHIIPKTVSILITIPITIEGQTVAVVSPDSVRTAFLPPKGIEREGWHKSEKGCAKEKTVAKEVIRARPKAGTRAEDGQVWSGDNARLRYRCARGWRTNRTRREGHTRATNRMHASANAPADALRRGNGRLDANRSERP